MPNAYFTTGVFTREELDEKRRACGKQSAIVLMGQELRSIRKAAGISRNEIAPRCGTSADILGRFEHGIGTISYATLAQLCKALKVSLVELLALCSGGSREDAERVVQLAETWKGKPLSLEDLIAR